MPKRARIIYNPKAGSETLAASLPEILDIYEQAGYETSAFRTTATPLSAQDEARRAVRAGFDLIVAAGGDGTLNEVIGGVAGEEHRPKVALIPAGTTNDFARALHIPTNSFVEAARLIEKERAVFMDIGRIENDEREHYFMNVAATGSLTELTYEVTSQMKAVFGYLAYLIKGLQLLPQVSQEEIKVHYDDQVYEGKASMVLIALTNSIGGFEQVAPDKVMGDGRFTLIIVKPSNILEMIELVRQMLSSASHIHSPHIIYEKVSSITIEGLSDTHMPINLDGEFGGNLPATFTNIQQHIEFVADWDKFASAKPLTREADDETEMTSQIKAEIDSLEQDLKN